VVVSESSVVRVFDDGEIISEILPELWLLRRDSLHLKGPYSLRSDRQVTVASKND
jgi:diadenylate cyclase